MMFLLATLIVLTTALLINAILQFRSLIAQLITIYIFSFADIAFTLHIANLFSIMNREWLVLLIALIILLVVFVVWHKTKRKNPILILSKMILLIKRFNFRNIIKESPYLLVLSFFLILGYLLLALLIYVVPPNNVDSVATHMNRVVFWLFHGNFFPWDTEKIYQIIYPVNAQLQIYWSVLFTKTDHFAGFVQYFAALASALAIVGISRINGLSRKQSIFPGIIFLTLPAIVLQSTTTQNDLVITALFIISIYFFFLAIKEQQMTAFALSGVSIGLAVGTKQTMFFLLVPYIILLLSAWIFFKKVNFKQLFHLGWISILTFLLIGSQIFISNYIHYGHPLGARNVINHQALMVFTSGEANKITALNTSRLVYQMADLSGLPDPLWGYGIKLKALVTKPVLNVINLDIESTKGVYPGYEYNLRQRFDLQEDFAWYGPIGFIILIPFSLFALINGIRKKILYQISSAIFFFLFLFLIVFFRPGWDPYQGRYFMPVISMLLPLLGGINQKNIASRITVWLFSAIAISTLLSCLFLNSAKPITGERAVWKLDRIKLLNLQNTYLIESMETIEPQIPLNSTVGLASDFYYYIEYPFFGRDLSRNLIPIYPDEKLYDEVFYQENGIQYLVFYSQTENLNDIPFLKIVATSERIQLYQFENIELE
jgi:hypothetical protein